MTTLLLQGDRPMSRKERILQYLVLENIDVEEIVDQNKEIKKENEKQPQKLKAKQKPKQKGKEKEIKTEKEMEIKTEKELEIKTEKEVEIKKEKEEQMDTQIEAVFQELLADPDDGTYNAESGPKDKLSTNVENPVAKKQKLSNTNEFLNTRANILKIIGVCENDAINKKKRKVDETPDKKIIQVPGDSTLEYFEDCQTIEEIEAVKATEKKIKRRTTPKKQVEPFVHITGDTTAEELERLGLAPHSSSILKTEFPEESVYFPYVSQSNPEEMIIGPNGTIVKTNEYNSIDWFLSAPIVTRKLLLSIFGREILSTHSLTGKPSPAFLDQKKPVKKPLDAKKVADIIYIVTQKKDVKAKEIRLAITSKCADEQKMRKSRLSK